ncbi:MAG: PDZ domain-containing protein [Clostridia bacterium]|nr:PDZ domain-containing protein [Clostridia bacterium]
MEQYENKGVKKGLVILLCVIVAAASSLVTLAGTQLYRTHNGGSYTVSKEYYDFLVRYKRLFEVETILQDAHLYDAEEEDLVNYAIKGLTAAFGDVYTTYLTPQEYAQLQQDYDGEMAGVGLVIGTDPTDLMATIVRVYPNTPAEAAGVQKGDKIIAVDGESVLDSEISDIAALLRGEIDTQVSMTVIRGGEHVTIQMTRGTFTIDRVSARMLEHNIGYIQVTEFTGNAHDRFMEELNNLTSAGMKALIIDLRDNPGGYLDDACEMADVLLPEGKIVYMEDHAGEQEVITSDADHIDIPSLCWSTATAPLPPRSWQVHCRIITVPPSSAPPLTARVLCRSRCPSRATARRLSTPLPSISRPTAATSTASASSPTFISNWMQSCLKTPS